MICLVGRAAFSAIRMGEVVGSFGRCQCNTGQRQAMHDIKPSNCETAINAVPSITSGLCMCIFMVYSVIHGSQELLIDWS